MFRSSALRIIALPFLILTVQQGYSAFANTEAPLIQEVRLFAQTLNTVVRWYAGDVQTRKLFYASAHGLFGALDSHSEFVEPERFQLLREHIAGTYAGIGTALKEEDGVVVINSITPGSMAERAGLELDDQLMSIDGISTEGKPIDNLTSLMHGDPNTTVFISVLKKGTGELVNLELMREHIQVHSVKDVRIVGKHIGYFRITHFRENTVDQVDQALKKLDQEGLAGLIIDLRANSGGVLERAVELAERFLPKGKQVSAVFSKIKDQNKEYTVESEEPKYDVPLIVLVNHQSASASEIFAAAIQDHRRGSIIGSRTYGKASAQSIIPLYDGSGMKLTTARYLRPNGSMISEEGILPDHVIEEAPDDESLMQYQTKYAVSIMREMI